MYAIVETGGKQIKVEVGQKVFVEKLDGNEGDKVTLDKVLLLGDKKTTVGNPYVKGATVTASVVRQGKQPKIRIYKYKAKANERKTKGHRQPYTLLKIESINL